MVGVCLGWVTLTVTNCLEVVWQVEQLAKTRTAGHLESA